jgi:hypothetical protein
LLLIPIKEKIIKILLAGNLKIIEFYENILTKNEIQFTKMTDFLSGKVKDKNFNFSLVFVKDDVHTVEEEIKEIKKKFYDKLPIMLILDSKKFSTIDSLYNIGINRIFFDFKPESVLSEIKKLYDELEGNSKFEFTKSNYIINFYENNGVFAVDLSGPIMQKNVSPLKLMFEHYLGDKRGKIKGVVYIFSNIDESFINFINIWALLRVWNDLNVDYSMIFFLANSQILIETINRYFGIFGLKHTDNLLEVVKEIFPEMKDKSEQELFDFSSQLLTDKKKK